MFELDQQFYPQQKVSIPEFVLVINGIIDLSNFSHYTNFEIEYCYCFIENSLDQKFVYLTKYEINNFKQEDSKCNETSLSEHNSTRKNIYCPKMIDNLRNLTESQKLRIYEMVERLNDFAVTKFNDFPSLRYNFKSVINENSNAYYLGELIDWIRVHMTLAPNHDLPLTDWATKMLESDPVATTPQNSQNNPDLDGWIEIRTLPKIIQLMINIRDIPEYDKTTDSFIQSTAIEELDKLAKKMNIYLKDNARTKTGLGNINAQKVIAFVQKDNK